MIHPPMLESVWTRNDHLSPDELTITIDYRDGGLDVRHLQNAKCRFWMWDDAFEKFDIVKHLRFAGIARKPERELSATDRNVRLSFDDYTVLFRERKDYPSDGIPNWGDSLIEAWRHICDNTGYWDPATEAIVSSVAGLKNAFVCEPAIAYAPIGAFVPVRFHAMSKPTPKRGADAWEVWQYICGSLGLVSWIDRDTCRVARVQDHFTEDTAPRFIWGRNILSIHEDSEPKITGRGVVLTSVDFLNGRIVEGYYPPPGAGRVRQHRPTKTKVVDDLNDYIRFNYPSVVDAAELHKRARDCYEQMRRQELKGKLTTSEMRLEHGVSILDLEPGDSVRIDIDPEATAILAVGQSTTERIQRLMALGYTRDAAVVTEQNWRDSAVLAHTFHVESLQTTLRPGYFGVELGYHSLIRGIDG